MQDLIYLKEQYQPDHLWITDDIFGLKPGWVEAFAGLIGKTGIRIPSFKIQSRVDLLLEGEYRRRFGVPVVRKSG